MRDTDTIADATARHVPYTASERRATAYHEAGHAVACLALGLPFKYVFIGRGVDNDPESRRYGQWYDGAICYDFGQVTKAFLKRQTREKKLAFATQFLCGALAQDYAQRHKHSKIDVCEGADDDLRRVARLIRWIHVSPGDELTEASRDAVTADIKVALDRAKALVKENFPKIRKLALALQARRTLTFDEVVALLEGSARSRYRSPSTHATKPSTAPPPPSRGTAWSA
jgi:hypothetical protein